MTVATPRDAGPRSGRAWAFVPAGLLVSLLGFQAILLRGAFSDPSFAVEERYYARAASWDATMAQDRENARLGWSARSALHRGASDRGELIVSLTTADGSPLAGATVAAEAFSIARSGTRVRAPLTELASGRYGAPIPVPRGGLWEVSLVVTRDAERFTHVTRLDVPSGGASP